MCLHAPSSCFVFTLCMVILTRGKYGMIHTSKVFEGRLCDKKRERKRKCKCITHKNHGNFKW